MTVTGEANSPAFPLCPHRSGVVIAARHVVFDFISDFDTVGFVFDSDTAHSLPPLSPPAALLAIRG
jgi:hypothetical protein